MSSQRQPRLGITNTARITSNTVPMAQNTWHRRTGVSDGGSTGKEQFQGHVHKLIPKGSLGSTRSEWSSLFLGSIWLSQSRHLVHLPRVPFTMYNICVVPMGLCKGVALVKDIDMINYCARPIWSWTCWFLSTDIHFPSQTVTPSPLSELPLLGLNIFCLPL